jgi:hypothetical protein
MNFIEAIPHSEARFRIVPQRLHLPAMRGIIERRILVNFRCDPATLERRLPKPFRPKLIHGWGMAGICLIRLRQIRPAFLPMPGGLTSENAAHRMAVEWEESGKRKEGVFIPRRDTNSLLNRLAGGRLFPGVHHAAEFRVWETGSRFKLEMRSADRETFVRVAARVADTLPSGSVFKSLAEASEFFQAGALGWSSRPESSECDGMELRSDSWRLEPLLVERVESSFFSNTDWFPPGSAEFDSAFLMREIEHEWHARGRLLLNSGDRL